jgi:hypothetical protein
MEARNDPLRDRLLAEHAPAESSLTLYRKEVQAMLDRNERVLRREKRYAAVLWIYAVLLATAFLVASGFWNPTPERVWLASLAGIGLVLIGGAVELLKHFMNRSRVELLKEIKQLELHVLELQESTRAKTGS